MYRYIDKIAGVSYHDMTSNKANDTVTILPMLFPYYVLPICWQIREIIWKVPSVGEDEPDNITPYRLINLLMSMLAYSISTEVCICSVHLLVHTSVDINHQPMVVGNCEHICRERVHTLCSSDSSCLFLKDTIFEVTSCYVSWMG